jgi:formate dehydrogenase maturation protein FdhE
MSTFKNYAVRLDDKLKSCPFCGAVPIANVYHINDRESPLKITQIECENCRTETGFGEKKSTEYAIKMYNTRVESE